MLASETSLSHSPGSLYFSVTFMQFCSDVMGVLRSVSQQAYRIVMPPVVSHRDSSRAIVQCEGNARSHHDSQMHIPYTNKRLVIA